MKYQQLLRPQCSRMAGLTARPKALACCVLLLFAMLATTAARAQSVKLPSRTLSVSGLFSAIEKQTGYLIVYSNVNIDKHQRMSFVSKEAQMSTILSEFCSKTGLAFELTPQKYIVLSDGDGGRPGSSSGNVGDKKMKAHGKVTTADGEPVIGATVRQKGTNNATVTDVNGNFSLDVPRGAMLVFTYVGTVEQEKRASDNLHVTLQENTKSINEVVVVGYGSQLRRQVTGAISSVKAADIEAPNAVSADNLLQGKVAGLTINAASAQPGAAMSVNIRGALSPNGSNEPLYVVDGIVISSAANNASKIGPSRMMSFALRDGANRSPLATLNPDDIASIDVLKDASATAIYGSQAANGVILITTKKGQAGAPRVSYSGSLSVQNIGKYYKMFNAHDFMEQCNLGAKERWLYDNRCTPYGNNAVPASGWPVIYTPSQINDQTSSYNHIKDITRTGVIHDHNVSVSAGSERLKFYSSLNFFDQKAILKTSALQRISGRINVIFDFNRHVSLSVNNMYSIVTANNPSAGHYRENYNEANQTNAAMYFSPRLPLYDTDGELSASENELMPNPQKFALIKDRTTTKRLMVAPNLEVKFTPWLKGNVQLSIDKTDENRDIFSPMAARLPQQIQKNFGGYSNAYNNNYGMEEYLTFDKKFAGGHYLNAVLGTGYYKGMGNNYQFCVFNLPTDVLENNNLGLSSDVDDTTYGSYKWERNKLSFFGRISYTWLDRYILGATLRRDGSSAFAENHKWGWFPGVSAAWIVSSESFMKSCSGWLDYLKLRAGIGTSGNESILTGNTYMLTTYGTPGAGGWFFFNNTQHNGMIQKQKGNKDLKWETDVTFNIGADFQLYGGRVSGSLDYYVRSAKDLLDFAALPQHDVVSKIAKNVGETRSAGVELALKALLIQQKEWKWNAYVNLSHNKSYWVKRNPEVAINPWVGYGDELRAFYGWKTNGIFKSKDEIQNYTSNGQVLQPRAFVGNLKYVDINGDGVMNDKDIVKLGNWDPTVNYGVGTAVNYKNWTLSIDAYGVLGQKSTNGWGYNNFLGVSRVNESTHALERWSTYNPEGWRPGLADDITGNNNKSGTNDFTLKNMCFLRVKNIKLSYTLPRQLTSAWNISNASVFFDLQNSLLLTNYDGLDPEMEHNAAPFPIPRTLVFGVNVSF